MQRLIGVWQAHVETGRYGGDPETLEEKAGIEFTNAQPQPPA
jgi:hypothetical protein